MKDTKLATLLDTDPHLETPEGKLIELGSPDCLKWLGSNSSFRFIAGNGGSQSYTARRETVKGGGWYWYGYRKVKGKLHKRYIGKSEEITLERLKEIAAALEEPSTPRAKKEQLPNEKSLYVTDNERLLENKLWTAQSNCENLQAENESLRTKLAEALKVVESLRADNETLRQKAQVELDSSEPTYQQLKAERDKLDKENEQLHEKNGDLGLDIQKLQEKLEQARAENQSQPSTSQTALPDLYEIRDRILKETRSDKLKAVSSALDKFIAELKPIDS